jgi:elongation factor P--(R)-beta-lysine ligase
MIISWQPSAPASNLRLRAEILKKIRLFFEERDVLEVETPLLCHATATDPQLASFITELSLSESHSETLYLQTSPEFAMKRLLAAGSGSIYQICKAFRNGETGRKHNPEFTLLEWYRLNFNHVDLMNEVDQFLCHLLPVESADRISYRALFNSFFSINPHTSPVAELKGIVKSHHLENNFDASNADRDFWLDFLLTHVIEPELGLERPIFIYDYPASQAGLAKIKVTGDFCVGERFEVYFKGMELANGYHELADKDEQLARFNRDNHIRNKQNLPSIPVDRYLLDALSCFPSCAGVALGIDRLVCLAADADHISEVITFPTAIA